MCIRDRSTWVGDEKTLVNYDIEFEFKNAAYQRLSRIVIDKIGERIFDSFLKRFYVARLTKPEVKKALEGTDQTLHDKLSIKVRKIQPQKETVEKVEELEDFFDPFGQRLIRPPPDTTIRA
eukprot:TRINITY_DN19022_c0_g1_i1.p1 TRINITY_DN19022_c0_g1~~TRINITY_DN19022_c0_g1_i1.p1  ORF type:complete len:140 (-),score=38.02 TRINITY_DN19022_c0_g1_i1:123-485(-)